MLSKKGIVFDLIFIDPPYCKEMIPEAMKIIKANNMLKERWNNSNKNRFY